MNKTNELTWEEWADRYKPIKNDMDKNTTVDGYMFETYGKEVEYVKFVFASRPNTIWTMLAEGNTTWIESGFYYINRIGYFITEEEYDPEIQYLVDESTWGTKDAKR